MATTDNTQTTVTADGFSPTDYDQVQTLNRTVKEHHHGHQVDFTVDSHVDDVLSGSLDDRVKAIVNGAIKERENRENVRANLRNRNRLLTLFVVLAMELIVPTLYGYHILPAFFVKYEVLAITAPDALLTFYAYFRKY